MVPVVYQAYPGGPQQVYYVPAQGVHAQGGGGFLEGIRAKIRDLASTDKLEGFSLSQTFSETFKHHGPDAVDDYAMVGSSRTTPPIEMVETGWPRPWMFFRQLAIFVAAFVALYAVYKFTGNQDMIPPILFMGAFAVPIAVLVFMFEMNTPRNVSVVLLAKLFVMGGVVAICTASLEYMVPVAGNVPGIVEESAKLFAVLLVVRGTRYKYELNGILFGCAVGAGFACFETSAYGLNAFLPTFVQGLQQVTTATQVQQVFTSALSSMVDNLIIRGVTAPFLHVVWTAIAAGAFWRVKGARPASLGMLVDSRFLKAYLIPVAMHTLWDASILFPNLSTIVNLCLWIGTGLTSWYVLFGLIQQGLQQVKSEQQTQLQSTLVNVEATLGLGAKRYAMQPQGPAGA
jgi:RsiW-degrading membrane proteinase PrsW (M82 family)